MRPYVIINGVNSNTITGLIISKLPPVSKPQMRVLTEQIDGRDGDINTPLGFSAYDKPLEIGLTAEADVNEVIAYFNQAGEIIFSNEPDKYYKFAIYDAIDFEKLIRFKTATINLHTQPYKYSNTQGALALNSGSNTVVNSGNTVSKPDLVLEGSGVVNLSINNRQIIEADLTDVNRILIDSDTMNAYEATLINPIKSIKAEINPVQDLHGYSKPWSGGAGKNKADKANDLPSGSGITITVANDGTLTINGTSTEFCYIRGYFNCPDSTATYTWALFNNKAFESGVEFSVRKSDNSSAGGWSRVNSTNKILSFTPSATPTKWQFQISSGITFNNAVFKPMIVSGNTAPTDYEPYSNICPISGFNSANITRCGVNLVNINTVNLGDSNPRAVTLTLDKPLPKGTYTLSWAASGTASGSVQVEYDGTFRVVLNGENFTANNNVTKFYFFISNQDYSDGKTCSISNLQLESGTTPHAYEPYNGQTATVNFGQTVYGGSLDVTNGKLTITHKLVTYSGDASENWIQSGNSAYINNTDAKIVNEYGNGISDQYEFGTWDDVTGAGSYGKFTIYKNTAWTAARIAFALGTQSVADFKASLANSPVTLVYELATPIEITTTPENLSAIVGQNNVYADTNGDTTVTVEIDGEEQTLTGEIVTFNIDELEYELGAFANRIVTGNYDNIKLEVGSNNVELTGAFTGGQLTKYSRWL